MKPELLIEIINVLKKKKAYDILMMLITKGYIKGTSNEEFVKLVKDIFDEI